jgi:alkaline phosphatase D
MNLRTLTVVLAALAVQTNRSYPAELMAGPLVGHTTTTSTRIWVETDTPTEVTVDYWIEARVHYANAFPEPMERGTASARTATTHPFTATVDINGLKPGWLLHYSIKLDDRPLRSLSPQAVSLMPPLFPYRKEKETPAQFSVAFVSCTNPANLPIQRIWRQIPKHRPSAMLFLGDNNYMPSSREAYHIPRDDVRLIMAGYHRELRNLHGLRDLVSTTPTYGIWDDHDFGPGNSDRTFQWREESLEIFQRYWPNPPSDWGNTPGVFHTFTIADAQFFMLDNRTYRDPNEAPDRKTMFGEDQLNWLKDGLVRSQATFKVIANGGTMLVGGEHENWQNYGRERDDFLSWMFDRKIEGVIFIAGDWHVGTINRLHRPQDRYPLYELISSKVGIDPLPFESPDHPLPDGHHQSAAPMVTDLNYGSLAFSGPIGDRSVTLRVIDEAGTVRIRRTLGEKDLKP